MPMRPSFVMTPDESRVRVGSQTAMGVAAALDVGDEGTVGEIVDVGPAVAEPSAEQAASSSPASTRTRMSQVQRDGKRVPIGFCENRQVHRGGL